MTARDLRLVGLAQGDPTLPRTTSGTALHLFDALDRRYDVVARLDVDLTRRQRYALAALTFRPDRQRWAARLYWWRGIALEVRSRNSARALRSVAQPFDLAVQIHGIFQTRGAPYAIFTDNTIEVSRRLWPEWVPVEGRALERLYDYERRLYGEAEHVFTLGSPAAQSLRTFYGVAGDRVSVVGGGVNFATLPVLDPAAPRGPVVLFVGREWRRKGGEALLDAFARVRAEVPDATLRIVGTEEPPRDLPGVEVLGPIADRDELAALYAQARVFCLPSLFEPYGYVLAEAMAYGVPVVATRSGAFPEIVEDGRTGILVEPGDPAALARALTDLLRRPDEAARMGAAGRERVETHLNWDAVVDRMAPALEAAAERVRRR